MRDFCDTALGANGAELTNYSGFRLWGAGAVTLTEVY